MPGVIDPAKVERDIADIGKTVNEDVIVSPRSGLDYDSLPRLVRLVSENGMFKPFETEAQLLSYIPEVDPTAAKALDTKKVWIWKKTSAEGVEPKVFEWIDTGLSEIDLAKKYVLGTDVDQIMPQSILGAYAGNINLKSVEILGNHVNFTTGYYIGKDGILFPFPSTKISDYISVKPNESFTINPSLTFVGAVYDKYLNFIDVLSGIEGAEETFTINQSDAAFIRFNVSITDSTKVYMNTQQTIIPWLENTPDSIVDALPILLDPKNAGNLLAGVTYVNGGYINDKNEIINWPAYKYTNEFIEIHSSTRYIISFAAIYVGVYFDENKNFIGAIKGSTGDGTNNYEFSTPPNAKYLKVNISNSDSVQSLTLKNAGLSLVNKSAWMNKKIAWYGTSIPAGYPHSSTDADRDIYSHANLAVHDLGGIILNICVPAGGIGLGVALSFSRLTDSINYQNSLLNLIGTDNEPDLIVFDYGVNDYDQHPIDMDAFNPNDPFNAAMSIDSRDANTFIGAHNKIIDEMLSLKPDMKFCFITHFSNDNANPNIAKKQDFFKQMNLVIKALADYWSAPILNLHEKTGYRNRSNFDSITPVMPDHIHPASGDGRSVESLRNIMRQFLVSIA
jgi:hypothetical protein